MKRNLKGKQVSISENLTKRRYEIYKAAMNKYGLGKVWTNEGRITTEVNERYTIINMAWVRCGPMKVELRRRLTKDIQLSIWLG